MSGTPLRPPMPGAPGSRTAAASHHPIQKPQKTSPWHELLKTAPGRSVMVCLPSGARIEGECLAVNLEHLNFAIKLDTGEIVLIRNMDYLIIRPEAKTIGLAGIDARAQR